MGYNNAKMNMAQVNEQTGVHVGKEGMDVTVLNHTQNNGGILTSDAPKSANRFSTGTYGESHIKNHSELKTRNISVSGRTSGLPIFDDVAPFTTKIEKPKGYENMSSKTRRYAEMKNATLALKEAINKGQVNKNQFTKKQLEDINQGKVSIEEFTWHHNAQSAPNNMQLVPYNIHDAVRHIGEGSLSEGR
nr:HNH endonuclease [Muribacter muris]